MSNVTLTTKIIWFISRSKDRHSHLFCISTSNTMLRTIFLSLILFVSLSSTSLLRKSIVRRQNEPETCDAIEGFDCKCTYYRVTCTSDRDLPPSIKVLQNEQQKYQSVELVINGERAQNVHDYTFEPVKQLYKPEADNLEFRIKFEKFSELHLSSPSIFNKVFPDNLPSTVRKIMALEVYNPLVQPNDNAHLFSNLNVDSLELYVLYPFRGTFQQLFNGADIKFLRLSGGDIRSDVSQPFTGNIARLELAKQASQLSVQNFPAYPAHELIINAFYVTDFTSEHPPNYSNLGEVRIYSQERIPANAFRNYPNLHTLSITTDQEIDPHALDGLHNLEKLTIKDTKPSLELLNNLPNVKEFETNVDKLSEREQCDLVEKLANGQVAVQAIPNGYACTCVSAYLDTASGRYPCDAQNCEQSSCAAIRDNFDAATRTFKTPPPIKRVDGSDALRPREPKVYTAPFQVASQDQEKFRQGSSQHAQSSSDQESETPQESADKSQDGISAAHPTVTIGTDQGQDGDEDDNFQKGQHPHHPDSASQTGETNQEEGGESEKGVTSSDNQHGGDGTHKEGDENGTHKEGDENGAHKEGDGNGTHKEGDGNEVSKDGEGSPGHGSHSDSDQSTDAAAIVDGTNTQPTKKGFSWLPIIIIVAAIVALLLIGLIILIIRKRRNSSGYSQASTSEHAGGTTAKA
ncbi:unnamed protein product [Rotaria magnacalcarata]